MLRSRIALISTLLTMSAALAAAAETPVHKTFNVAAGGTLTIDADVGEIRVSPGSGGVTVDVYRHGASERDLNITFDQQQNDVTVRARAEHSRWFNWNEGEVEFVVTVPSNYNLDLRTSGGDIKIGDLQGSVHSRTSGGKIETGSITGPVDARTSGGGVSVASASGNADLRTSGGSIEIRHAGGDLLARTSGGSIAIDEALGTVDAETSGGSIRARFAQQPKADSRLSTSGGNITVSVASSVALDLDAHTSGGDVDSDVPVTLLGHQRDSSLEGKINGGGPRLVLRSSGGGIRLQKM